MDEPKILKDVLLEAIEAQGIEVKKVAQLSGVPERFIRAFIDGEHKTLPAAPYTRGYIKKISEVLNLDADTLWRNYEREYTPLHSGVNDRLPGNRFSIKYVNKKIVWAGALGALILIYGALNSDHLIARPYLTIQEPSASVTTVGISLATVKGRVENPKDMITINGSAIFVNPDGEFSKEFTLDPGANTFTVTAKRFLGKETSETLQIIYEKTVMPSPEPEKSPPAESPPSPLHT